MEDASLDLPLSDADRGFKVILPRIIVCQGVTPVKEASVEPPSAAAIELSSMGFPVDRCQFALKVMKCLFTLLIFFSQQTNGDSERAVDWLMSHIDEPLPSEPAQSISAAGLFKL